MSKMLKWFFSNLGASGILPLDVVLSGLHWGCALRDADLDCFGSDLVEKAPLWTDGEDILTSVVVAVIFRHIVP
jgi:hypothetical protein